jgi:hypothetical protein
VEGLQEHLVCARNSGGLSHPLEHAQTAQRANGGGLHDVFADIWHMPYCLVQYGIGAKERSARIEDGRYLNGFIQNRDVMTRCI